jgi:senataxin
MSDHSLSTALREFGALRGLPYYEPEMLRDILGGRSAHLPMMNDGEVQRTMSTYDVNEPQAKAIIGSTRIDGFALIQG